MSEDKEQYANGYRAISNVKKFLAKLDWVPEETEYEGLFLVDLGAENMPVVNAHFDVRVRLQRFICYFNFGQRVPETRRFEVMKFITYANFDMVIGNFELNLDNGFLRFKSAMDFTGVELTNTLIRNTVKCGMDAVEAYAAELVKVIGGEKTGEQGVRDAESGLGL